jgi:hypothetical protein
MIHTIHKITIKTEDFEGGQIKLTLILEDEVGRNATMFDQPIKVGDSLELSFGHRGGISLSNKFNELSN